VRFTLPYYLVCIATDWLQKRGHENQPAGFRHLDTSCGNWSVVYDGSLPDWKLKPPGSLTILSDGTFSSSWGSSNRVESYRGTWQIEDGRLILTNTNRNDRAELVPSGRAVGSKIVRVDAHQLVYETTSGEEVILSR
jgi:hypothetical protein